jgi:hypothetical protein
VRDLGHLSQLLDESKGEFVELVMESGGRITLDRRQVEEHTPAILATYQVPADRSSMLNPSRAIN